MQVIITLRPYGKERQVERMEVELVLDGVQREAGEELCAMQLSTVTIPGCTPEAFQVSDGEGEVPTESFCSEPYPLVLLHEKVKRKTSGTIKIQYTVRPRILDKKDICGPYFDFRCEDGGANSAGISFLPQIEGIRGKAILHWDMSRMPEGSRGVCTFGEGDVEQEGGLELFRQSYYAMGDVHGITEGEFGFYWIAEPPIDMAEIADYTRQLFGRMQKFFRDTDPVYRIFVRKDPFKTSGGTALHRSYMFGWNDTQPFSVEERRFILAHEMVHNWPQLNDNPYGITTWYSEGTAEFYSVMLPLRMGLITPAEAAEEIQKRTDAYYTNPTRRMENTEAAKICWQDRRAQRIAYGRGMLFLANTDAQIRQATAGQRSLDDVVLEILEKDRAGELLGNQVFLDTVREISGLDVTKEWENMCSGMQFAPRADCFDGHFTVKEKEMQEADTGNRSVSYQWGLRKRFTPDAMKYISYVTWPAISEDGTQVAYVSYKAEEEGGTFPSKIYWIRREDGSSFCLTGENEWSEKQPCFLKDGERMAYLSDQTGEYQVFVRNLKTGETRQITKLRHGVERYSLSEDGSRVVFEAVLWPEEIEAGTEFTEMSGREKESWKKELDYRPYYITDLTYKMDEWHGMRKGEFSHIGTVYLDGSNAKLIDTQGVEAVYPAWSHRGEQVAFYGYPYSGAKGRMPELFVCGADGSNMCQVTEDAGICADHCPIFTMDDRSIISMVYPDFGDGSCVLMPWKVNLAEKKGKLLMDKEDESVCYGVNPLAAGRLEYGERNTYFTLSGDGNWLYFISGLKGRTGLYRISISEKEDGECRGAQQVIAGNTDLQAFAMNRQGIIVTAMASWTEPAELYMNGVRLTDSNSWLKEYELSPVEEHWIRSKDKKTDLQYFLVRPAGIEAGKKYPAVLDIKGGPETMYGLAFWHEFQALAGAGIAVIYGNPRGSVGFGREFCKDGVCWKQEVVDDLLAMVKDAVSQGWIDEKRIGVTGGSYGGYMTNKLIGRTNVFAAAVTQRCLANTATSYGTGDMGFVSAREIPKDFRMLTYLEGRARGNIISYVDHFKVPLLILHAYEDYRCGFEQAEQVFVAMKERNPEIPVRLVMFPGENHGMTRTGKLHHQIRHLEEMTGWFEKYLSDGQNECEGRDGERDE